MLKSTVEAQPIVCDDLRSMMSTHVTAHDNLLETVSEITDSHHAAETAASHHSPFYKAWHDWSVSEACSDRGQRCQIGQHMIYHCVMLLPKST